MVNTFLPYPDMVKSLDCLDDKRLGKQRVETYQLIRALEGETRGWRNHPACVMWEKCIPALKLYHDVSLIIWQNRGFKNSMKFYYNNDADSMGYSVDVPDWWGDEAFHASHRSNLLRKDPIHYSKFNWTEPNNLPYIWPNP
jgi:hypothetical protein